MPLCFYSSHLVPLGQKLRARVSMRIQHTLHDNFTSTPAEMKQWDPVKTLKKKVLVALLNPFLSVVIKPKNVTNDEERNQKKPAKCLSEGQPNVNLLTFVSAKHKPTTERVAQWMSYYKRGFSCHMTCSVLDGSLLCYFDLNNQVFSMIRKPTQHNLPRFPSNISSISSNATTGRRENFG